MQTFQSNIHFKQAVFSSYATGLPTAINYGIAVISNPRRLKVSGLPIDQT